MLVLSRRDKSDAAAWGLRHCSLNPCLSEFKLKPRRNPVGKAQVLMMVLSIFIIWHLRRFECHPPSHFWNYRNETGMNEIPDGMAYPERTMLSMGLPGCLGEVQLDQVVYYLLISQIAWIIQK